MLTQFLVVHVPDGPPGCQTKVDAVDFGRCFKAEVYTDFWSDSKHRKVTLACLEGQDLEPDAESFPLNLPRGRHFSDHWHAVATPERLLNCCSQAASLNLPRPIYSHPPLPCMITDRFSSPVNIFNSIPVAQRLFVKTHGNITNKPVLLTSCGIRDPEALV